MATYKKLPLAKHPVNCYTPKPEVLTNSFGWLINQASWEHDTPHPVCAQQIDVQKQRQKLAPECFQSTQSDLAAGWSWLRLWPRKASLNSLEHTRDRSKHRPGAG